VVDAVRCAVEIQRGMLDREPEVPDERRIRFRIGVNLGDAIVEEHDILGEGVNVAARLVALAEPGGIRISRVVRDQIRHRLPYPFEDGGEQSIKNIARPVRVYGLRPEAIASPLTVSGLPATSDSQPVVAPPLSIVVLPFTDLSDDREQQYFADGITDDLTTDLSRVEGMRVMSRNTAFTYRNKPVDTKQIGRELGVRYVLEGEVQRLGNQLRINAQLIDADTDAHLWAVRFDRDIGDLLTLQNEITGRIANTLHREMIVAEAAHQPVPQMVLREERRYEEPAEPTRDANVTYRDYEARPWLRRLLRGLELPPSPSVRPTQPHTAAGSILWNPPGRMRVGRTDRVEVRLGDENVAVEALRHGLQGRGTPRIDNLEIAPLMRVAVTAEPKDFTIQALSTHDQFVRPGIVARWDFGVTPLRGGLRRLRLAASMRIKIEGKDEVVDLPSYESEIQVSVAPVRAVGQFCGKNWQWIAGTVAIPLVVWAAKGKDINSALQPALHWLKLH
jgi:TolB-like protein